MPFSYSDDAYLNWLNTNRTPAAGELCHENDTLGLRIGDGVTPWQSLRPFTPSPTPEYFNANSDTLRYLRTLLGRARSYTGTPAPLVMLGASCFCGVGGANYGGAFPYLATKSLWGSGIPVGGTGWVPCNYNSATDSRWTAHGFTAATNYQIYRSSTGSGQTETFMSDSAGSTAQVAVTGNSGPFIVSLDGGTGVTVTPTGGAGTVYIWTSGTLGHLTHTISVTSNSATAVNLLAVRVSQPSGLELHNLAISGSGSATVLKTGAVFYGVSGSVYQSLITTPGVVMIGLDVWLNDGASAANTATTIANLGTAISDAQTAGHQVILLLPPQPNPALYATSDWQDYQTRAYGLATSYNVPLLDYTLRWKDYATATSSALGYMADNVHANALGQEDLAAALQGLLTTGYGTGLTHWDPSPYPLIMANGYGAFGGGFYYPSAQKDRSGVVRLSGLVTAPATISSPFIASLPINGYRPGAYRGFATVANNAGARIDIYPDGSINYAAGPANTWVSLEGISYWPDY